MLCSQLLEVKKKEKESPDIKVHYLDKNSPVSNDISPDRFGVGVLALSVTDFPTRKFKKSVASLTSML